MKKLIPSLLFIFLAVPLVLAGGSSERAELPSAFRWPISEDPSTLDPAAAFANTAIQICQNLFDGLTALDNEMNVVPAIAERWEISEDGKTYTFYLRDDVTFHNGKKVTAQDFKYSWERALWPETGSYSTFMMGVIEGAGAVEKGETKELSGLRAIDDTTLEVKLRFPAGYFLVLTTRWSYWVVDRDTVETHGDDWVKAGNLVGTGAYRLAEWREGERVVLEANPDYFGKKATIERIEIPIIPDVSTAMLQYEAGDLDAVSDLTPAEITRFQNDKDLKKQLELKPVLRVTWLGFNFDKQMDPFWDNLALRQAVAYGIDRQRLVDVALAGAGTPAYSFLPPGMPGHDPKLKPYSFDLEKAKEKLAEAGYPDGKGLENHEIVLSVSEQRDRVAVFEFLQAQLRENLGIEAKLEIVPGKTYGSMLLGHEMQMFRGGMGADYPDPQEFMEYLAMSGMSTNYGGYSNEELDRFVKIGNEATEMKDRLKAYGEAERIFLEDAAIVPLFYNITSLVTKPYVKGFQFTPIYIVPFNQVSYGR
jgi:ABC-type oligopeptide transport system substrate-binding subunit